jgi:hypothetical protein
VAYRAWYGPTRAVATLVGAAGAVVLIWLASQVNGDESNAAYWAMLGLIALGGLAMAFSQLLGGWTKFGIPRISGNVLLLAFVPTLVVGGWILLAHQPDSALFRNDVRSWSDDVGLLGLVMDFQTVLPALAFLVGLTFGLSFDTTGPRTRAAVRRDTDVVERRADGPVAVPAARATDTGDRYANDRRPDGPVAVPAAQHAGDADEPVTAERDALDADGDDGDGRRGFFGRPQRTEYSEAAPPTSRRTDDVD